MTMAERDDGIEPGPVDGVRRCLAALVGRAIRSTGNSDRNTVLGNILAYASRFPQREMGVILVSDMHRAVGDTALSDDGPWLFEPWEELKLPRNFQGGGGTSFIPVFDWVEQQGTQPETLIYFTDAQGAFPEAPPNYPVIRSSGW